MGIQSNTSLNLNIKKKLISFFMAMMMTVVIFSVVFLPSVSAENDGSTAIIMNAFDQYFNQVTEIDVGENIFVGINFDTGTENLTLYNVSLLTYNETSSGLANATVHFDQQNWTSSTSCFINNDSGSILNITASGNLSGNKSAFIVNLTTLNCGILTINVSGVQATENGTDPFTIDYSNANISLNIHPQKPYGFTAEVLNATQIQLNYTKGIGADKVYIERNTVQNWQRGAGTEIANTSSDTYTDTGLNPESTYYYRMWSYNNSNSWFSLRNSSDGNTTPSSPGEGSGIFVNGQVIDNATSNPISGAEIFIFKMDMPDSYFDEGPHYTNASGHFVINVTGGGDGEYVIEIEKSGYVGYVNWTLNLSMGQNVSLGDNGIIELPALFNETSYIKGYINASGSGLEDADVMLLDTDFSHMVEIDGEKEDIGKETSTNATGYFSFNISYPSAFNLIAFYDGYYAVIEGPVTISSENTTEWNNITLSPAEPDVLDVVMNFTDLDDATVTVNRTVIAAAAVLRFSLDFNPEIGNSNGQVSASEASSYADFLSSSGPGLTLDSMDEGSEEEPMEEEGGHGPSFLALPTEILIDGSTFDSYVSGSHNGNLDNIANTNVNDNATIYYNATFNVTLDGPIEDSVNHAFNLTTYHNRTVLLNLTIRYNDLYNISSTQTSTNMSIQNTLTNITFINGNNNSIDCYAYANISLSLNETTLSTPIIETPTWNVTDEWIFNKTGTGQTLQDTYTIHGKPLRRWDRFEYYMGEGDQRYLCYKLTMENSTTNQMKFVTISDLQWLNISYNGSMDLLINDLDFPLYTGKTWQAYTWWGQPAQATVISSSTSKETANETFNDCILVNYSNQSGVIGQQWYSPDVKFFVNRTQNINGGQNVSWDITSYSHAPFFESVTIGNITNQQGKITEIYANITMNASRFYNGPSDFMLEGPFYKESFTGPPTDIMWVHNENGLRNLDNSNPYPYVNITYDGGLINASGVNGPYTGNLELRMQNQWGPGDMISFASFTVSNQATDFVSPAVRILNISSFGNDTNSDGQYDYLTVNVTINSTQSGTYRIHSGLDKVMYQNGWEDWRWITGTGTDAFSMDANTQRTIQLNYNGYEIYEQGYDGPYKMHLEIMNDTSFSQVAQNETNIGYGISYTDFSTPSVYFNKSYFNQTGMHDYINDSGYFTVNVSIMVGDSSGVGDYELCGGVHFGNLSDQESWGDYITGRCNDQITLDYGENIVPLNFNLADLSQRLMEQPGNHTLKISLDLSERVGDWIGAHIDWIKYFTLNYSANNLPDPPISFEIYNDTTIQSGDYLMVSAYLNISSDDYANQTYDLHGGVHYNNSGDWWFIAGMGENINIDSPGNYTVSLNFSGMEIAGSGQDGPYMIWMGIDSWPDHTMIANDEYFTGPYTALTDFVTPDVQFVEGNTSAEINGSDYFTVNASVSVNQPGNYHIHGGVHYIENQGDWDNWVFIAGTGQDYYLSDNTNVSLNFDQGMIRDGIPSSYNDPLVIHLGLENSSSWQHIDHLEYETNQAFSENAFSSAAVTINSTSYYINGDGNLQVNVTYYAASTANYNVHGGVHDSSWWFITGMWNGDMQLTQGEHTLLLNFSGSEIYNSLRNGPYNIWIGIETTTDNRLIANKEIRDVNYNYNDFSGASSGARIKRENMSDGTVDYMNSTGSKSYVTVNVTFEVNGGGGTYWLDGGLNYVQNNNWEFITGTGKEITLVDGNQTIPLNFNAGDIYSSGKSGSFKVWIGLRDMTTWNDIDNHEYTTQSYSSNDAPPPPVQFIDVADGSSTIAYINGTDYFTVNVTLNVSDANYAGNYDLHGGVNFWNNGWWQHVTGTGQWVELEAGLNSKTLNFNVGMLQSELPDGYNDNLSIWVGINDVSTWEEITHHEYITETYQKSDFPGAKMTLTGQGDEVWGDNFTINVTLNASSDSYFNNLEMHGGLHWIDQSNGWDEWIFITGFHQEVSLSQNGTISCNFSTGDLYTALQGQTNKRLTAWISVENISTWTELAHVEYETTNTYSGSDFNPPSISLNCTGDYYNSSYDQLQVNVTLNATSAILSQSNTYEIHSGIHYVDTSSGWDEWRFISGFNRQLTLSENMSIKLNFSGTAIYETGETGPFEIWVGLSRINQWEDLAHDEYTTNDYSGTSFAEPDIFIVENRITDYANDSDVDGQAENLTINVTMNASTAGTEYILEGGLHWKQGHQWYWIGWAETNFTSASGQSNISLNFDGQEIYKASTDGWSGGNLVAWLSIRNSSTWNEISFVDDYETENSYSASDFSLPSIEFNTSLSLTESTIGDTLNYSALNITVPITVRTAGTYNLHGGLFDPINKTLLVKANTTISTTGEITETLSFNGTKIYNKGYNGTYEFRAKITSSTTEYDRMKSLLSYYNYTDFQEGTPPAWIENNFSSFINNGDLVINVTINVSSTGDGETFEIYGDLFNGNNSHWITANSTTTVLSTGENNINITFDGTEINTAGESGNYTLEYVRLSQEISSIYEELDFMKNAHEVDYHTYDEFGGA